MAEFRFTLNCRNEDGRIRMWSDDVPDLEVVGREHEVGEMLKRLTDLVRRFLLHQFELNLLWLQRLEAQVKMRRVLFVAHCV